MGSFVRIKCGKCNNEQVLFIRASTTVKCLICDEMLVNNTGGKADLKAKVIEELD
jgi:small subunit ribosomal protein S27e